MTDIFKIVAPAGPIFPCRLHQKDWHGRVERQPESSMRLFSIVLAAIVSGTLYLVVFERDQLMSFLGGADDVEATSTETAETQPSATAEDEDDGSRIVSVVALKSLARDINSAVLLRGRTEAARQVDVRAETSGLIISDPLPKGSSVAAGDLMCEIDPGTRETMLRQANASLPEAQARVVESKARLAEAEINFNAATKLSEDGFASDTRVASARATIEAAMAGVEAAKSGVESAEATIAAAQEDIKQLDVLAPFAGLLETDTAELGTLMQPGALCATVIQLDPIKLVGFVPETEVVKVSIGALAGARLVSGREVQGKVTFLSRSADPETRTFRVEIQVPNADLSIRDGQTAEILIASDGQKAHLLPASAMTLDDSGTLGVRVVNDETAGFSAVSILRDTPEGVWVTGLPEVEDVIVTGQEYVIDGVKVDVTYQKVTQ